MDAAGSGGLLISFVYIRYGGMHSRAPILGDLYLVVAVLD